MSYRTEAQRRWPEAEWIVGDGAYATVARCDVITVQLHVTLAAAEQARDRIDRTGCGHPCRRDHDTVDLDTQGAPRFWVLIEGATVTHWAAMTPGGWPRVLCRLVGGDPSYITHVPVLPLCKTCCAMSLRLDADEVRP